LDRRCHLGASFLSVDAGPPPAGRFICSARRGQETGYSWTLFQIRNPIYLFGGLAIGGEFVALGWYILTAIFVIFNLVQYLRIKREEQVLTEAFGDEYRAYKARTWF
jgi:protein-S-isoprenylcysteine O-methyltransferase Ste14